MSECLLYFMCNSIVRNRPIFNHSRKESKAKKRNFKNVIKAAFRSNYRAHEILTGDVCAPIYYLLSEHLEIDTDKLAKAVLGNLTGCLFEDDRQIRIRMRGAGNFNLSQGNIRQIDLTRLPSEFAADLIDGFDRWL